MTEKLKTMNELFLYNHNHSEDGTPIIENSEEFENLIKAEAIKWVKEFRKGKFIDDGDDMRHIIDFDSAIEWIKHFFNLTDEDLK